MIHIVSTDITYGTVRYVPVLYFLRKVYNKTLKALLQPPLFTLHFSFCMMDTILVIFYILLGMVPYMLRRTGNILSYYFVLCLDLSHNKLTEVPEGLLRCKSLLVLNLSHNQVPHKSQL